MKSQELKGKIFVVVEAQSGIPKWYTPRVKDLVAFVKREGLTVNPHYPSVVCGFRAISTQLRKSGEMAIFDPAFKLVSLYYVYAIESRDFDN